MQIYINDSQYLSVIQKENNTYSCQVMKLIQGLGGYKASLFDVQDDIVHAIVYPNEIYSITNVTLDTLLEVFEFHKDLIMANIQYIL